MILSGLRRGSAAMAVTLVSLCSCVGVHQSEKSGGSATTHRSTTRVSQPWATPQNYRSLFDGKTLEPWQAFDFGGSGEPRVEDESIILPTGERLTGVTWHGGELPPANYGISFEAKRVDGTDFFCGLTLPCADSDCS